jgi:hypothetical protein
MEKKISQKIVIGLVSLSLLALICLNIYEYQKFKYSPPTTEIVYIENKATKNIPTSAQRQTTENKADDAQAKNNNSDNPEDKHDSQKTIF